MAETTVIRAAEGSDWQALAWLWQAYRHDLAPVVNGLPYADGRYQTAGLPSGPSPDRDVRLAWSPHPRTTQPAPVAFAVVDGLIGQRRTMQAFWVAPAARRGGLGRRLAAEVIAAHPGPWAIPFQHDNRDATAFWRAVADEAFGVDGWSESRTPVPVDGAPDDHWITSPVS